MPQCRAVRGASAVPRAEGLLRLPLVPQEPQLPPNAPKHSHVGMLGFGAALQARLGAPGAATRAPGMIYSPAVSDLLAKFAGAVFAGCVCPGSSVLLCSGDFTPSTGFPFLMRN